MKQFDLATLLGILAAFGLVGLAIQSGGGIDAFLNPNSLLIVLGGTLGATLINYPLSEFARSLSLLENAFFPTRGSVQLRVKKILGLARAMRSGGGDDIKEIIFQEPDTFFRKAIELLADEESDTEIRKVMDIELSFLEDRHRRGAQMFQTMGMIAPAMGLIGTLIGLVQMLQQLDDPNQIGPSMAVALLTTFYGAILANLVFIPIAGKLRTRSEEDFLLKELTIEGVAGIAEGINPHLIEKRILGFLPPSERVSEYE